MKNVFLIEAEKMGVPADLSSQLYDTLIDSFRVERVTIDANLYSAFGIVDDELDDLVSQVALKAQLKLPNPIQTANMLPVQTVRDILLFLNELPPPSAD